MYCLFCPVIVLYQYRPVQNLLKLVKERHNPAPDDNIDEMTKFVHAWPELQTSSTRKKPYAATRGNPLIDAHRISISSQERGIKAYPKLAQEFAFVRRAMLDISTEYIKESGKECGPPDFSAFVKYLHRSGYSKAEIALVRDQFHIWSAYPTKEKSLRAQALYFLLSRLKYPSKTLPAMIQEFDKLFDSIGFFELKKGLSRGDNSFGR